MRKRRRRSVHDEGTRFLLFPQAPTADRYVEPEIVTVSSPAGSVGPGPADERMYAIFADGKELRYGFHVSDGGTPFMYLPPWRGKMLPPAMPDRSGHFDYLMPGTPQFQTAHLFGTARFVLDVWEGYFGRRIPWHFAEEYDQLELSILPTLANAIIGWGFLEAGVVRTDEGEPHAFSLNFDVIAHELGHGIIYSQVGLPDPETDNAEYFGFHESAADLAALLASLHFDSVTDTILLRTSGNLYTVNKLTRFAELDDHEQIRMAANDRVMSEFAAGWSDEHQLAQPLTGAVFDTLVDIFHENLLDRGLIPPEMEDLSDRLEGNPEYGAVLQDDFDVRFARNPDGFKMALLDARDFMGTMLAEAWQLLDSETLTYVRVREALEAIDRQMTGGRFQRIIRVNFKIREIGRFVPGPRQPKKGAVSHAFSSRTMVPQD
jgi:hypothetical protein